MSFFPGKDPAAGDKFQCDAIKALIVPRTADLGDGFTVRRALPSAQSRMVGPFVFFDHFGPTVFKSGNGLDVRPHPHIGLATVTYLFDGEIMHRDSLGTAIPIRPGAVNWMTAGRGIVHSERTDAPRARQRRQPARPANVGGASRGAGGDGAGLRPSRGRANFRWCATTARPCAWWSARPTARARRSRPRPRRCSPTCISKPEAACRSTPTMRSARSTCSTARSTLPATSSAATACWCSSPATRSPSAR